MTVEMPLIVLSAIGDEDAKVRALAAGTDDYVAKPFGPRELIPPAPGQPAPDRPGARAVVDPDRGAERRPGLPHGRARRRGGPSDPDRVRLPQAAGPQSRAADNTPGSADGWLGGRIRQRHAGPARPHRQPQAQDRARRRARRAQVYTYRSWGRLPVCRVGRSRFPVVTPIINRRAVRYPPP